MKHLGRIVLCLCICAACLALCACGNKASAKEAKAAFEGEWELYSVEVEEGSDQSGTTADDVALLKELGLPVTLSLKDDDSFELDVFGEVTTGEWSASSTESATLKVEKEKLEASLADGKLSLSESGVNLVFQKQGASDTSLSEQSASSDGQDTSQSADGQTSDGQSAS